MSIGFIGTGALTSAMVTGLRADGTERPAIQVSPRNAEIAADLARRFSGVSVASSNQDVVDTSDVIVLAVRPRVAHDVTSALRFRAEHEIISVVSGWPLARVAAAVAPATVITRAVPLPAVAERSGLTAIYPPTASVAALFDRLGGTMTCDTEEAFSAICTATATIASYLALGDIVAAWASRHGIPEAAARDYQCSIGEYAMPSGHVPVGSVNTTVRVATSIAAMALRPCNAT